MARFRIVNGMVISEKVYRLAASEGEEAAWRLKNVSSLAFSGTKTIGEM